MKVGLIGRGDARGLGHISREFFRHVRPARTLIVEPRGERHPTHREWYPSSPPGHRVACVQWSAADPHFPTVPLTRWLDGLDVVYGAETFYDERVVELARAAGVATVLHVNPEFYRRGVSDQATAVWNQSPWLHDRLRPDAQVVPVPVAFDRFTQEPLNTTKRLRVLHIAGNVAAHDRNGTHATVAAVSRCTKVDLTVLAQRRVQGVRTVRPTGDYWDLYAGYDVLVMPRRYAGQCLPVQEALAAGLAVIMTDCSPNEWWPVTRVAVSPTVAWVPTPGGDVPVHDVEVDELAAAIQRFADDRSALAEARDAGLAWAVGNSWQAQRPVYEKLLHEATL